jgi:hypothetical protein
MRRYDGPVTERMRVAITGSDGVRLLGWKDGVR